RFPLEPDRSVRQPPAQKDRERGGAAPAAHGARGRLHPARGTAMRGSLRVRLLVSVLALLLPAAAAAGVLLVQVFGDRLLRDLDVALEEEAATIAALVNRPSDAISIPALLGQISDETDLGAGKRVVV